MSPSLRHGLAALVLAAAAPLAGCNSKAPPAPVAAVPAAPGPVAALAPGAGCGPAIARTQAVVDSDVATGNLNAPVGQRFSADLAVASNACASGRDVEAMRLLAAARARYGYP